MSDLIDGLVDELLEEELVQDYVERCIKSCLKGRKGSGQVRFRKKYFGKRIYLCAYGDDVCPLQEDKIFNGEELSFCVWYKVWNKLVFDAEDRVLKNNISLVDIGELYWK